MRGGGCTVQQSLTPEALRVVQQAVSLAQQRGHSQVTPLHVATILLSSPAAVLRAACLESHSHPLRCKALELCFNVALNRLPTSSSSSSSSAFNLSPYHHHHHDHPALSNALVAAFKRTQANQRRGGSVEVQAQQQPLLVVKVELPQLVLSILDDPSVSRVMREAGFSSTQVKTNVEKAVSNLEINSSSSPPSAKKTRSSSSNSNQVLIRDEKYFIDSVIDSLLRLRRKKSSVVIVGESLATGEALLRRIMQVSGEVADEALRDLQFANLSLSSSSSREEVEEKVKVLSDLAKGSRSTVIYMGDVESIADECFKISGRGGDEKYCPLKHAIMELGRLVSNGEGRIWVTGITTYEGYMGCISWLASILGSAVDVQPLFLPQAEGSLELSLSLNSGAESHDHSRSKVLFGVEPCWELEDRSRKKISVVCADSCSPSFQAPRNLVINGGHGPRAASSLPPWLQKLGEEKGGGISVSSSNQESLELNDPCKWSGCLSNPSHKHHYDHQHKKRLEFSWSFPSSSSSDHGFHRIAGSSEKKDYSYPEFNFWSTSEETHQNKSVFESNANHEEQMSPINSDNKHCCSTDSTEVEYTSRFKELSAENLKALCVAMEEQVPWQKHITSGIASTVLQCRSGMRKKRTKTEPASRETWLFFQGSDCEGKAKVAMELARLIFGSYADVVSVSGRHLEKLSEAVRENSHRVFLMEDVEQVEEGIESAIRRGRIESSSGEEVSVGDAIIILTCEGFESSSGEDEKEKDEEGGSHSLVLDLNVCANCGGMEWAPRISELVDGTFIFNLPKGV